MQGHEVRMPAERPDRDVVPHPSVVFEAIFQPFGKTQLAACIETAAPREGMRVAMGWA